VEFSLIRRWIGNFLDFIHPLKTADHMIHKDINEASRRGRDPSRSISLFISVALTRTIATSDISQIDKKWRSGSLLEAPYQVPPAGLGCEPAPRRDPSRARKTLGLLLEYVEEADTEAWSYARNPLASGHRVRSRRRQEEA
jgi:hypothetical protein